MESEWQDIDAALVEGQAELMTLSSEISILTHSYDRFAATGICRADVVALESIAPCLLTHSPVNGYTQYASQTNLSPALEGILGTIKDLILKAIGKMIEVVGRVIGWIAKQFARGFQRSMAKMVERNIDHVREVLTPAIKKQDEREIEDVFDDRRYNKEASTRLHEVIEDNIGKVPDPKVVVDAFLTYLQMVETLTDEVSHDLKLMVKDDFDPHALYFYESLGIPSRKVMEPIWNMQILAENWRWLYQYSVSTNLPAKEKSQVPKQRMETDVWRNLAPPMGTYEYQSLVAVVRELRAANRHHPRLAQGAAKVIVGGQLRAEEMRTSLQQVGEQSKRLEAMEPKLNGALRDLKAAKSFEMAQRNTDLLKRTQMNMAQNMVPMVQNLYRMLGNALMFHGTVAQCLVDIQVGYRNAT